MAEYIGCRNCESPDCKGCNLKNLETMLNNGKFDCMMNENRCINPAADVAPVRHGRWIHSRYEDCSEQFELVKCSQCNHEAYAMAFYVRGGNYCPNCGAKMDGGADNEA